MTAEHGAATARVVNAMAAGCRERFAADYGLAIGPFPPRPGRRPQPVLLALAAAGGVAKKDPLCRPSGHVAGIFSAQDRVETWLDWS